MDKTYTEATEKLVRAVRKQHDYRHLPRTRCVVTFGERLEFVLPEGTDAATFCQGTETLDPKAHQIVFPQFQADLQAVLVNFDTGMVVYVKPETKP